MTYYRSIKIINNSKINSILKKDEMETDNDRKRAREDDEKVENAEKVAKFENQDDEDGFSDDSFEFNLNLASQYTLSEKPLIGKARVMEVLDDSVIVAKLDDEGNETNEYHELVKNEEWIVQKGDFIHSAPEFGTTPIYHSDTLISCTNVASAASCTRRALLGDRFRDGELGRGNEKMLLGNLLHELFQSALENASSNRKTKISAVYLEREMAKLIDESIRAVIACGVSMKEMLQAAKPYYEVIAKLIDKLTSSLALDINYTKSDNINRTESIPSHLQIEKLRDIEENVWEPRLGLKGKVDVTANCTVRNIRSKGIQKVTIPMELKSGKGNSIIQEHRIQTQLYGMIQSFRHDQSETTFKDTTSLLMYIRTGQVHSIPIKSNEIDQIMQKRNTFAGHARHPFIDKDKLKLRPLPPPIDHSPHQCLTCFKRDLCAFWTKVEKRTHVDSKVQAAFDEDTGHIDEATEEYVLKWTRLGLLEQGEEEKQGRGNELWNASSKATINGVKIDKKQVKNGAKISIIATLPADCTEWTLGSIETRNKERISLSTGTKVAVAFGYCKRVIKPKLFSGQLKVELLVDRHLDDMDTYRIDGANNVGGGSFCAKLWLGNVWAFTTPGQSHLRQLLTGQVKPATYKIVTEALGTANRDLIIKTIKGEANLNQEQKKAIQMCLTGPGRRDFFLD